MEYLFTVSGFNQMVDGLLVIELQNKYPPHDHCVQARAKMLHSIRGRLTSSSGLVPVTTDALNFRINHPIK